MYRVNCLMIRYDITIKTDIGSDEEVGNRFSRWKPGGHLEFPVPIILTIFGLQVYIDYIEK